MRIAIDAMGGDYAPKEIIAGALTAIDHLMEDDKLVLFGVESAIREQLEEQSRPEVWEELFEIVEAPEVVEMDDPPVEALRRKRHSSIALMAKAAAAKEVDVVISAGNTGAFAAACQMRMRTLPGVSRPGIIITFPTFAGPMLLSDVGANIAPKPAHLYQYALMSMVYATDVLKLENPSVGLISVGSEDSKGNELVKTTNKLLREDERIDFVGNVEPRDFMKRPADILVCDGFVGNVILKLTEGIAESLFKAIGVEIATQKPDMVEHFKPIMGSLYARHDYSEYGGAPLIGVDGTCIICHGSSDARTIKNAILISRKQHSFGLNEKIVEQLKKKAKK